MIWFDRKVASTPAQTPAPTEVKLSNRMSEVIEQAMMFQKSNGDTHLAIDHILLALGTILAPRD